MAREEREKSRGPESDEVDASKGIFPAGTKHPEGAKPIAPGELGGGPYDESGRSGLDVATEGGAAEAKSEEQTSVPIRPKAEGSEEKGEPKGALPPHERKG